MKVLAARSLLVVIALAAAPAGAEIVHRPVACVPADRYARVVARVEGPMAAAELQFRPSPEVEWYSIRMAAQGGEWSGTLPRPQARVARFEYRIAMTDGQARTTTTPTYMVAVGETCDAAAETVAEVGEPIVVRVPAGAPVVPPVPSGFSPAGVVAAERPASRGPWRTVGLIAGGAAAVTVGAFASGKTESDPEPLVMPEFAITSASPAPGSDLSPSRDALAVVVQVQGEPRETLTFNWAFGLRLANQIGEPCLIMTGTATIGPERPTTVVLTAPLHRRGFCGNSYTTATGTLTVVVDGRVAREVTQPLEFRVGI